MKNRGCLLFVLLASLLAVVFALWFVPLQATAFYGPPAETLGGWQQFNYSLRLLWYDGLLTEPVDPYGSDRPFTVESGESVASIASRLEQEGLVADARAFRDYLVYRGLDVSIQAGRYALSPSMSPVQIASRLQDATPAQVVFYVLPGWRMEEIAAALPTSGLTVTPGDFMAAASFSPSGLDFMPAAVSTEGFLFPGEYLLPREVAAKDLVAVLTRNFALHLTFDLRDGFNRQGLSVYEAVTLASIVQREAVVADEQPLIASVFLNRLAAGMRLESDPTVQYALGYNAFQGSWWTNPLSLADLQFDSPFNTYVYAGLPPGPIANPGLGALQAVAYPAETPYYYFRALCDGSGRHAFAETFEEHLQNECP
ncbi:MAG: endolytic transglycosylase MltG [Chloroflexota bacterium]